MKLGTKSPVNSNAVVTATALVAFLLGLFATIGWRSGARKQVAPGSQQQPVAQKTSAQGIPRVALKSSEGSGAPAPMPRVVTPQSTSLIFQGRYVDDRLKEPLNRLRKFLETAELKRVKTEQVGDPAGDNIVRIEVTPPGKGDIHHFWEVAEKDFASIEPELRPFYFARVQQVAEDFSLQKPASLVLFVRQVTKRSSDEPSMVYWRFDTERPTNYGLNKEGQITTQDGAPVPAGKRWFDSSTFKPPTRLGHLIKFKYE